MKSFESTAAFKLKNDSLFSLVMSKLQSMAHVSHLNVISGLWS